MRKKVITLIIVCVIAFIISNYWLQFVLIQGNSMSPAYRQWNLVIVNKKTDTLKSGDVIVFQCTGMNTIMIKRIVAGPGDTIQIENGILYVNGFDIRSNLPYGFISYAGIADETITLKTDEYFVLGDNLEYSKDSRYANIGCIKRCDILGKVFPQIPVSR